MIFLSFSTKRVKIQIQNTKNCPYKLYPEGLGYISIQSNTCNFVILRCKLNRLFPQFSRPFSTSFLTKKRFPRAAGVSKLTQKL